MHTMQRMWRKFSVLHFFVIAETASLFVWTMLGKFSWHEGLQRFHKEVTSVSHVKKSLEYVTPRIPVLWISTWTRVTSFHLMSVPSVWCDLSHWKDIHETCCLQNHPDQLWSKHFDSLRERRRPLVRLMCPLTPSGIGLDPKYRGDSFLQVNYTKLYGKCYSIRGRAKWELNNCSVQKQSFLVCVSRVMVVSLTLGFGRFNMASCTSGTGSSKINTGKWCKTLMD